MRLCFCSSALSMITCCFGREGGLREKRKAAFPKFEVTHDCASSSDRAEISISPFYFFVCLFQFLESFYATARLLRLSK